MNTFQKLFLGAFIGSALTLTINYMLNADTKISNIGSLNSGADSFSNIYVVEKGFGVFRKQTVYSSAVIQKKNLSDTINNVTSGVNYVFPNYSQDTVTVDLNLGTHFFVSKSFINSNTKNYFTLD